MIAPLSLAAKQTLIFPAQLPKCFSAIVPLDVRAEHEATRQAPAPCSAGLVKQLLYSSSPHHLQAALYGLDGQLGKQIVLHAVEKGAGNRSGPFPVGVLPSLICKGDLCA